jgi:23S rRNA (uracil1939-C5)-methyltransferase
LETLDLVPSTFTYGGEVMGRLPDGRAVFVPFAIPGETVRLRLVEEKRGFARAELLEVLQPAPERITPRCRHFGVCGGCHYQHLPYPEQLAAKTAILRDQLERIGKIPQPPLQPAVPCPLPYAYRNHVQFHLTHSGQLGYHKQACAEVFAIQECHLPAEPLAALWPQVEIEPVPGLERLSLRLGAGDDLLLALEGADPKAPEFGVEELPLSAVYLSPAGLQILAGSDYLMMEVLDRPFRVSAESFFQVNTHMAEALVTHLLAQLPAGPDLVICDVYAGVGLFSAFLAPRCARLVAIEAAPSACRDFVVNLDEFDNVELYQAPAEDVLGELHLQPQVVVVDPPRAGLDRQALEALLALRPGLLAYVSCDPATLARDARRLVEGGYRLASLTPFDFFPQTYHIESLSVWEQISP